MRQYKGFICQFILPSTDEFKKWVYIYDIVDNIYHMFSGNVKFTYRGTFPYLHFKTECTKYLSEDYCVTKQISNFTSKGTFPYLHFKTEGTKYLSEDKEDYCVTKQMTYQEISNFTSKFQWLICHNLYL